MRLSLLFVLWALLTGACVAELPAAPLVATVETTPSETYRPLQFECDERQVSRDLPLRRMTRVQFERTIEDAVRVIAPLSSAQVLTELGERLMAMPPDTEQKPSGFGAHGFLRADQLMTQGHAEAHYELAERLAQSLTETPARLREVFGPCGATSVASEVRVCVEAWLNVRGPRLLRRDSVPAAFRTLMVAAVDPTRGAALAPRLFADALTVFFAAPEFIFHLEAGATEASDPSATLSPEQLASRVSYHLTEAPPDDQLWEAARSGALNDPRVFGQQVDRLMRSPRAAQARDAFFSDWLELEATTPNLKAAVDAAPEFAAEANGLPIDDTAKSALVEDTLSMTRAVFERGGGARELLTDANVYSAHPLVLALYGVTGPTDQAPAHRTGLLTRLAYVASGSRDTHPIRKGVRLRNAALCDVIGAPPPGAAGQDATTPPGSTTRQKTEALTEVPGSTCSGCHRSLINPLGFATEDFDGFGRHRVAEAGATSPLRTDGKAAIGAETQPFADAAELTKHLAESGQFDACFARQFVRSATQRAEENVSQDGCRLRTLELQARRNVSLATMMREWVLAPAFRRRVVDP